MIGMHTSYAPAAVANTSGLKGLHTTECRKEAEGSALSRGGPRTELYKRTLPSAPDVRKSSRAKGEQSTPKAAPECGW